MGTNTIALALIVAVQARADTFSVIQPACTERYSGNVMWLQYPDPSLPDAAITLSFYSPDQPPAPSRNDIVFDTGFDEALWSWQVQGKVATWIIESGRCVLITPADVLTDVALKCAVIFGASPCADLQ